MLFRSALNTPLVTSLETPIGSPAVQPLVIPPIPLEPWCLVGHAFDSLALDPWLAWLSSFRDLFGDRGYLISHLHLGINDAWKLQRLQEFSRESRVPLVAAGGTLYHQPERMILHDCLQAIATGATIDHVATFRPANGQFYLRPIEQLQQLYRTIPEAIRATVDIASRIDFSLDSLRYEYPREWSPDGMPPIDYLKKLTWEGAKTRYPKGVPVRVVEMLRHEIGLIEELRYEPYFLTVWDLVRFARSRNILCQGRGSAANSAVCYCLGVTSVDPSKYDLLFERFISRERNEAPDIDIDFEDGRREEVIRYVAQKYGEGHVAQIITFGTMAARASIRDVEIGRAHV